MSKSSILFLFLSVLLLTSRKVESRLTFESLLDKLKGKPMKKLSVAGAEGPEVLKSIRAAKDKKIADSILIGDADEIHKAAESLNISVSDFQIINVTEPREKARTAVKLVHDGLADVYMKGTISTKDLLQGALDKKIGLRTGLPLNVVAVYEIPSTHQMFFLTDPGVMIYPTLEDKINMINGAVEVTKSCGLDMPKVAVLTADDYVNPKIINTVEAKALADMNERGEIKDCIVDGPISMDLAIDPTAAHLKKSENRKIKGDADILVTPNIAAGNVIYKMLTHVVDSKSGNILIGTSKPVILTSRSDTFETKLNSMVLAVLYAEFKQNQSKA